MNSGVEWDPEDLDYFLRQTHGVHGIPYSERTDLTQFSEDIMRQDIELALLNCLGRGYQKIGVVSNEAVQVLRGMGIPCVNLSESAEGEQQRQILCTLKSDAEYRVCECHGNLTTHARASGHHLKANCALAICHTLFKHIETLQNRALLFRRQQ